MASSLRKKKLTLVTTISKTSFIGKGILCPKALGILKRKNLGLNVAASIPPMTDSSRRLMASASSSRASFDPSMTALLSTAELMFGTLPQKIIHD